MNRRNWPLPILTVKLFVSPRQNREVLRKAAEAVYEHGRRITQDGGGHGPWIFLEYEGAPTVKSLRMKRILKINLDEDRWVDACHCGYYSSFGRLSRTPILSMLSAGGGAPVPVEGSSNGRGRTCQRTPACRPRYQRDDGRR